MDILEKSLQCHLESLECETELVVLRSDEERTFEDGMTVSYKSRFERVANKKLEWRVMSFCKNGSV